MTLSELIPPCEIVPAGPFLIGTPDTERSALAKRYGGTRESYAEESPRHQVDLQAFAMMRTPVTNLLWEHFILATGAHRPITWRNGRAPSELGSHPVVDVSWEDALAFTRWLSAETRVRWDLPTEAQWEKAARGDDGRQFPWGNTFDSTHANTREAGRGGTVPVGSYADGASPYGLLDMAGNVWEWTRSLQASYPYLDDERNRLSLPSPRRTRLGALLARFRSPSPAPAVETRRILRGGCYANPEGFARCACRFRLAPVTRTPFVGFRLVCDP